MTSGRIAKPTALKLIAGNPGKRPLNKNEPHPTVELPAMPAWLTAEARAEWERLGPVLVRLRLLTRLDRAAFAAYCQAWSRFVQAEQELQKSSPLAFTVNGHPMVNPWQTISNQAVGLMAKFLNDFGLTPAARSRINAPSPQGGSGDGDGDAGAPPEATFAF